MLRVNEFIFYEVAMRIHPFVDLDRDVKYSDVWYEWWQARETLDGLFRQRAFQFSLQAATKLYGAISKLLPEDFTDAVNKSVVPEGEEEKPIWRWQLAEIRESAKEFETVLRNECLIMDTYFVSKKGTHSTKDLVENAHHQIPEQIRKTIPEQTKMDFDQAGKCMAFDVPTAAAFHLLRGTEAVIRKYYESIVPGPKQAPLKMRNWGTYIRLLSNHNADKGVLALLTHLKDAYRNPVLHPEENFTDERVQVLFGVCVSAVVSIEMEIAKQNTKSAPLQFPATGSTGVGTS